MATEARPMIRQRRMGSCMRSGAVVGEAEGESRCGARVRVMCAVRTRREAMPRRPCGGERERVSLVFLGRGEREGGGDLIR